MKYCLKYDPKLKCAGSIDELLIEFNARDSSLPQFLEAHSNQTIVIKLSSDDITKKTMELLRALREKYLNFKLILNYSLENTLIAKRYDLPFFFSNTICDWESLIQISNFEPTDVIISGPLAFDIRDASHYAHKRGIRVRCIPNLAQSFIQSPGSLYSFFIRPEDVDYYSKFVDTLDMAGNPTFYKIYHDDKKWSGPLNEIIFGLRNNINNKYIGPEFARIRSNCRGRCGFCTFCPEIQKLARNAEKVKTATAEITN